HQLTARRHALVPSQDEYSYGNHEESRLRPCPTARCTQDHGPRRWMGPVSIGSDRGVFSSLYRWERPLSDRERPCPRAGWLLARAAPEGDRVSFRWRLAAGLPADNACTHPIGA